MDGDQFKLTSPLSPIWVIPGERGDPDDSRRFNHNNKSPSLERDCVQPHSDGPGLLRA